MVLRFKKLLIVDFGIIVEALAKLLVFTGLIKNAIKT